MLVFATNNAHKLNEVRQILGPGFDIRSLDDIGCHDDIPETAATLEGNAMQKARYIRQRYGCDCFADDTGLEVTALGGAPGVHSARYAEQQGWGGSHDSQANMACLLSQMEKKDDRRARFRTVIALLIGEEQHLFEGIVEGDILRERQGSEGFGYDPVFRPKGYDTTFAQMTPEAKNAISHRGRATQKLAEYLLRHASR